MLLWLFGEESGWFSGRTARHLHQVTMWFYIWAVQLLMRIPQHTGSFMGRHHIWGVLGRAIMNVSWNNTCWLPKSSDAIRNPSAQRCFPNLRGEGEWAVTQQVAPYSRLRSQHISSCWFNVTTSLSEGVRGQAALTATSTRPFNKADNINNNIVVVLQPILLPDSNRMGCKGGNLLVLDL